MCARTFDVGPIGVNVEKFKKLLDVFREVFEWGGYECPDKDYLVRLLKNPDFLVVVAEVGNEVIGGLAAYVLPGYEVARPRGLFTAFLKCALTRGFTGSHAVCE